MIDMKRGSGRTIIFQGEKYRLYRSDLEKMPLSKQKKNQFGIPLADYNQDTILTRAYKDKGTRRRYKKYQSKSGKKTFINWLWSFDLLR